MTGDTAQNKRNIVFLICDMQAGGAQRVASILCNAWAARGDRVTMVTYEPESAAPFYPLSEDIRYTPLDLQTRSTNYAKALISNSRRVARIRTMIKQTKPDAVLCFGYDCVVIGVLAGAGLPVPVIGCDRSDPSVYPQGVWRRLRDLTYPHAAKLVVQTPAAAEFCKRFQEDITIIANPVSRPDTAGQADIEAPERPFIASLGRMSDEKGHDILIEAFAAIAENHGETDLLLIGDGPNRARYQARAKELGLEGRIHFPGRAKNPFPVLEKARAFVLPSRFEGFPNALAEAMALGLPCIGTDSAIGIKALIHDDKNGLLISGDNPSAMAEALERLLSNPDLAQRLGAEAAKITQILSPAAVLTQWDGVMAV